MPGSSIDVQAPFDPTGYVTLSGAQILQLLAGLSPYTDKGFIVATTDVAGIPQVPDATVTTKWINYLWLRQMAGSVGIYAWAVGGGNTTDPTTGTNILQWRSLNIAGIANGSITGAMIADNTITDSKIATLDYSKLTGAPVGLPPSGDAAGDLTGTYPNPTLGLAVVTGAKTALNTLTGGDGTTTGNLAAKTVQFQNLKSNGVGKDMLRTQVADTTIVEWFTPPILFTGGIVVPTANANKVPVVNAGATDFSMITQAALAYNGASDATNAFQITDVSTIAVAAGINAAHGLGSKPVQVRAVIICIVNDNGYVVNDEIDVASISNVSFTYGADATNVFFRWDSAAVVVHATRRDTGVNFTLTNASWRAKVYASRI